MRVSKLELHHFRNHTVTDLTLPDGVSVFVGANGQGKTNLVEAVGYLAYGSSHRVSMDKALVQHGHDHAVVRAQLRHHDRQVDLACEIHAIGSNRAKIMGNTASTSDLGRLVHAVLFTPEDLGLIRGEPAFRRRYLDHTLVVLHPHASSLIADYDRVVKQRNALLKSNRGRPTKDLVATLRSWDERFIELATSYTQLRRGALAQIDQMTRAAYEKVAPGHSVSLGLDSGGLSQHVTDDTEVRASYQVQVEEVSAQEWDRGITLVGPHRDDVGVLLNGLVARTHSSQGEAWSLALAMRMAQAMLYREESTTGDPVIILDDVLSELDRARREALEDVVSDFEQVLVTAAVWEDVPRAFHGTVWDVVAGKVTQRER